MTLSAIRARERANERESTKSPLRIKQTRRAAGREGGTSEKAMVVSPRKTLNALIGGVYVRRGHIHFPRPFITL